MRGTATLTTLIQLNEAEIQRLSCALSDAEAELSRWMSRSEALNAERELLQSELRQARLNCTRGLEGRRITAQAQQLQYQEIGRLNAQLARTVDQQTATLHGLEQAQGKVDEVRVQLTLQLGQKTGYVTLVERAERSEALRRERLQDEAMDEQWAARPRSC
jgi:flagellar biosynthesis chaperone FliJ